MIINLSQLKIVQLRSKNKRTLTLKISHLSETFLLYNNSRAKHFARYDLSGHFSQKQAKMKVVKIKNPDFSYWA